MARGHLRVAATVVAAIVVAEAAVLTLRPREGIVDPVPVDLTGYFTGQQLQRAEAYRGPQRLLGLGVLAVEIGVLARVAWRPPAVLTASRRHPLVAAAAAGAALSLLVALAPLPLQAVAHQRAREVGLVTQSWGGWAADVARSSAIGALFAALGAVAAVGLLRRAPRMWWLWGSGVIVGFGAFTVALSPVVIAPLFNEFRPLPAGDLRRDVLVLADRAGVRVGEVYVMDASRRTTAANAYVAGLGATKRVVLYDTLLENFPPEEVRVVVAHELGHQFHADLWGGLGFLAVVTPVGLFAAGRITERLAPDLRGPAALPALALSVAVMVPAITWVSNQLSRAVEARADTFSLALTGDPAAFAAFERRITLRNLGDPDPPAWATFLLATHPPTVERLGAAEAWAAGRRPR
ncbi:MAG TPA: M48 family metallopeptidase [Solirubrobacteraceae bacterium]|nr:M48 family metallopeptidase [Solirubrobacteraceae bacterium]